MACSPGTATLRRRPTQLPGVLGEADLDAVLNAAATDLRLGRAETACERFGGLDPGFVASPERCQLAGLILIGAKAPAEALGWFVRARTLRPGYAEAARHMGAALQQLGRFQEALKAYDEALSLGLRFLRSRTRLARARP